MSRVPHGPSRGLRLSLLGLAAIFAFTAMWPDDADARPRRKRVAKKPHYSYVKKSPQAITASPRYAAIVIDANTRKVLHQAHADALRHPASLTKIMTLYLLFERLEAGKIKLSTQMPVSAEAARQPPTKLGLKPGQTLSVEDAIKGLVTKSANDAAVVIAEALAGSEEEFARQMTRKARALGMTRTVYRNASGLPDPEQVTTAREQALLGIAIRERFPNYYRYFSTPRFVYHGRTMRNHNRLLGTVAGVDGIKTGYTRASGYNLVTSMHRGGRHVVAVVLGGATGRQRDARMRELLNEHIMLASATKHAPVVAAAPEPEASAQPAKPQLAAAATRLATVTPPKIDAPKTDVPKTKAAAASPPPGSRDPIKPIVVKTVMVKVAPAKSAVGASRLAAAKPVESKAPEHTTPEHTATVATPLPPPAVRPAAPRTVPAAMAAAAQAMVSPAAAAERPAHVRTGWAIQIGAFEDEAEARQRLAAAKAKAAKVLKNADAYTERTVKGDKTWYRARFSGFDRDEANAACKALKRNDIVCMALKI